MDIVEKVNKPEEVDDNISHKSTVKAPPFESMFSTSVEEEENQIDIDETSLGDTLEQEDPKQPSPPDSP